MTPITSLRSKGESGRSLRLLKVTATSEDAVCGVSRPCAIHFDVHTAVVSPTGFLPGGFVSGLRFRSTSLSLSTDLIQRLSGLTVFALYSVYGSRKFCIKCHGSSVDCPRVPSHFSDCKVRSDRSSQNTPTDFRDKNSESPHPHASG